jgi:sigma-B regulation protein RsbQ
MSIEKRNNVQTFGRGPKTLVFAHGFGCDQSMWRYLAPGFQDRYKVVLFDLVGSGRSDLSAYDRQKYDSLHGYASDVVEIISEFAEGPAIFVGHSVSATIGMLASIEAPERVGAQIMVGPSPCYINDGDYVGGFTRGFCRSKAG